ncbi:MAG: adenylate/guanylate cyclase domain-containing protein [Verrucomicrobiales bacterium]
MSEILKFIGEWTAARGGVEAGLDTAVWDRFGCERTVLVVDMEGFTASTREMGIVHYLRLIQRMQEFSAPMLDRHGGQLVRYEADNLFAVFGAPEGALAMMVELVGMLEQDNQSRSEEDQVHVSAGIDHGKILLDDDDFFGDAVNLASKLGEDLARSREVLVTEEISGLAAGDRFVFHEVGSHEFTGASEPVFKLELGVQDGC